MSDKGETSSENTPEKELENQTEQQPTQQLEAQSEKPAQEGDNETLPSTSSQIYSENPFAECLKYIEDFQMHVRRIQEKYDKKE